MNWWIFFFAVLFWIAENNYFGWNLLPKSDAELIADGIVMIILAIACIEKDSPMTNNTERKAFEEWFDTYKDPNIGAVETMIEKMAALMGWQAALAQREQGAPSLCTAEEAAELAWNAAGWYVVLSDAEQLAAIINADRAMR
jgi:hypothetical protein